MDGPRNVHKTEAATLTLDLCERDPQQCLLSIIRELRPESIHIALPCGTGSRARERPIPALLRRQGAPAPRQLRDNSNPLGRPNLTEFEQKKVRSANELALFTVKILQTVMHSDTIVTIENPTNSWMWLVIETYSKQMRDTMLESFWHRMTQVQFSNCAHGGDRPKNTTFRSTHKLFLPLAMPCPQNHEHKPYTLTKVASQWSFDTAKESEYPALLCRRFVQLLKAHLSPRFNFSPIVRATPGHCQHRRHRASVPEYHHVSQHKPTQGEYKELPPLITGESSGEEHPGIADRKSFGVFHTPLQFISRAQEVQHPYDSQFSVEDVTRVNLFDLLTKGSSFIAHCRLNFARKLASLAKELSGEEARFQASLPDHVQRVLKGKRILLFKHLLKELHCPDKELVDLMLGADLVGVASKSPFFDQKLVPASTTPEFALVSDRWQRKRLEAVNIHKDDPELARVLWDTTLQEVEAGFLQGPFEDISQVKALVGSKDVVCSRRFAIMQGGKPRIIDDLKQSGMNCAFTSVDQLSLHDVDYISSLCHLVTATVRKALDHPEFLVRIPLQSGSTLEATLHDEFRQPRKWLGRCIDLSKGI